MFACRRVLLVAAGVATIAVPTVLEAQFLKRDSFGRIPRRHIYPFIGMLVSGAASSLILTTEQRSLKGVCSSAECIGVVSLGAGAMVGLMIGREKDALHELRYRGGRPLNAPTRSLALSGEPIALTADRDMIATAGLGGVHVVQGGPERFSVLGVKAPGLRGINDVALASRASQIGIVGGGGFYRFPIGEGQGVQLRAGGTATAVALWDDQFLVATGSRLERIPRAAEDPIPSWPGIEVGDTVRAIKIDDRGLAWAVTGRSLVAVERSGDSLHRLSETELPSGGRRLAINGTRMAVALGDSGVVMLDISTPSAVKRLERWSGARFVYDVALTEDRLFIASGIDGVTVLGTTGSELVPVGLARELGFVVNVAVQGDDLIVIDRSGTPVLRKVSTAIGR
jgi:hypothetical protein